MDYSFFLHEIDALTADEHSELIRYVTQEVDYSVNNTFWNLNRHKGIDGVIFPSRKKIPVIDQLLDHGPMLDIFDPEQYRNYEIDRLHPSGVIAEHTDTTTIKERCALTHRVHLPLTGDAQYFFKRGPTEKWTSLRMVLGRVYLFNNVVTHSVVNSGNEIRINLMLSFNDELMQSKVKLYDKFNLSWNY